MTGTGSPGGTEQLAARFSDFLGFADVVAMGAHYSPDDGKVSSEGVRPLYTDFSASTDRAEGSDPTSYGRLASGKLSVEAK